MNLSYFNWFVRAIKLDAGLLALTNQAQPNVYRHYDSKWYNETGAEVIENAEIDLLTKSRNEAPTGFRRERSQKTAFFRIDEIDVVVAATFPSSPRSQTQKRYFALLRESYSHSKNAFDAVHDQLTALPNRRGFEKSVEDAVRRLKSSANVGQETGGHIALQGSIALLALDLDHFKQTNDSHGHQYGDCVLAAFAWRLAAIAEQVRSKYRVGVTTARSGGEEFAVLLADLRDQTQALEIAHLFLAAIGDRELPTDDEWRVLSRDLGLPLGVLPHRMDRKVTVSIGHAALTRAEVGALDSEEIQTSMSRLVRESDAALYRAKLDGRACVRSFREIRDRLGRVIEHHTETDVVAIDIGSEVGVRPGHEFLVFHPMFAGDTPFHFADGRSKKQLGKYPKYSSGRLSVFKVEREVGFCNVLSNTSRGLFLAGSRLEYVPLGSITHLVATKRGIGGFALGEFAHLQERAKKLVSSGGKFAAGAVTIRDILEIEEKQGVFVANEAIASLYKSLVKNLPIGAPIASSQPGEFAFIVEESAGVGASKEGLSEIVGKVIADMRGVGRCTGGLVLVPQSGALTWVDDKAADFARLASHAEGPIEVYNRHTPDYVVQEWRKQARYDDAYADYRMFKKLGVVNAALENRAGLCFLEDPREDYDKAIECFRNATGIDTKERVYALNLGYALWRNDDYFDAYAVLSPHHAHLVSYLDGEEKGFEGYLAAYGEAALMQQFASPPGIDDAMLREILRPARNKVAGWFSPETLEQIEKTLVRVEPASTAA